MERISKILQLPVIKEGGRLLPFESKSFQEFDFFLGRIAAEGRIPEEFFESRLLIKSRFRYLLHELVWALEVRQPVKTLVTGQS
jgi:hypothetical protein